MKQIFKNSWNFALCQARNFLAAIQARDGRLHISHPVSPSLASLGCQVWKPFMPLFFWVGRGWFLKHFKIFFGVSFFITQSYRGE